MVSFWWVLAAFIGGGCAGVLVMSLMYLAGGLPELNFQHLDLFEPAAVFEAFLKIGDGVQCLGALPELAEAIHLPVERGIGARTVQ